MKDEERKDKLSVFLRRVPTTNSSQRCTMHLEILVLCKHLLAWSTM